VGLDRLIAKRGGGCADCGEEVDDSAYVEIAKRDFSPEERQKARFSLDGRFPMDNCSADFHELLTVPITVVADQPFEVIAALYLGGTEHAGGTMIPQFNLFLDDGEFLPVPGDAYSPPLVPEVLSAGTPLVIADRFDPALSSIPAGAHDLRLTVALADPADSVAINGARLWAKAL
jgi:hypothetical protein